MPGNAWENLLYHNRAPYWGDDSTWHSVDISSGGDGHSLILDLAALYERLGPTFADQKVTGVKYGQGSYDASDIQALAESLKVNGVLKSLNLRRNDIRDKGAAAIADALAVNGVLKNIDLSYNNLGDEGEKAIHDAVSGREGLELEM